MAVRQPVPASLAPADRPAWLLPPENGRTSPARVRKSGAGLRKAGPPRRVVIVEDEALVALTLEAMIQDVGHIVVGIASNVAAAVSLAVERAPDVVVMDIGLGPKGDEGLVAAAAIRRRTSAALVFVTAYADQAMVERVRRLVAGARIMAKPVSPAELAAAIEEA